MPKPKQPVTMWTMRRKGWTADRGNKKARDDKYLELDEYRQLLKTIREDDNHHAQMFYDLCVIAGNFGLRCIEILRMEFSDLAQLRANYFMVRSAKKKANVLDPIYVGYAERDALLEIKERRRKAVEGDNLFELPARSVRHLFGWYINLAGLNPRVSFHALRHVACKAIMNAANQNHLYCTVRLRHESLGGNNTSYRYALPTRTMMIEAANAKGVIL